MIGRRVSIAIIMKLTAVVALNFALFRHLFDPSMLLIPPVMLVVVLLDHVLVQAVVFGRPLGIFYFTFLFTGIVSTIAGMALTVLFMKPFDSFPGSFHILEAAIQHSRAVQGTRPSVSPYIQFPMLAEADQLLTCGLCLSPAWIAAALVSRWCRLRGERKTRSGRTFVAFLQGSLIGFALALLGVALFSLLDLRPQAAWFLRFWYIAGTFSGGLGLAISTWKKRPRKLEAENTAPRC